MNDNNQSSGKVVKIIFALSAVIAAISMYILLAIDLPNKPLAGQGGAPNDVSIGGNFILTDQDEKEFSSDQMKGQMSLVYFGFTSCPDICPTSLQKIANVLVNLEKYRIDVLPIFITVDPPRDSSASLKEYLSHFHHKLIGLTGSEKQIKEVADLYKVFYAQTENSSGSNRYMIDHSSFVYLMDKNGKYMKHFYLTSSESEILDYIRINK